MHVQLSACEWTPRTLAALYCGSCHYACCLCTINSVFFFFQLLPFYSTRSKSPKGAQMFTAKHQKYPTQTTCAVIHILRHQKQVQSPAIQILVTEALEVYAARDACEQAQFSVTAAVRNTTTNREFDVLGNHAHMLKFRLQKRHWEIRRAT